ncbi:bestrophin protein [Rhizoctonia solani]|uniref:Bestrophin protein n=1 Tax=Rhizoctonia solani TaxID=456999 RepID=A0A8H8NWB2_9AGAM|nr:bestrophin protein [Rhizoctonia solani]QRW20725.1 bestrophin protein [Rhizoctonia solani]
MSDGSQPLRARDFSRLKQRQPEVVVTPPSVIQSSSPGGKVDFLEPDSATQMANKHENHFVGGLAPIDPFAHPPRFFPSLFNAILATALFRCWNLILLFAGWATCVCLISAKVRDLGISSTLLTVFGTILGFVISYRTSSSFERYNEGRRLWSTIVLASRTFSLWFHVPDTPSTATPETAVEARARNIIEKRTAINLIEAFSVAVKHYLRGEEGIYYEDLYHLVKFLPAYSLPAGMPNQRVKSRTSAEITEATGDDQQERGSWGGSTSTQLPTTNKDGRTSFQLPAATEKDMSGPTSPGLGRGSTTRRSGTSYRRISGPHGAVDLAPASNPPKWGAFDVWPLSLLVKVLTKKGKNVSGKKAAKERAKQHVISHNIPLEITLYLSSYISALQQRKVVDVPTINTLLLGLNQLVDSLSGLERILTTPIPFSYGVHLWTVCLLYVFFLPFQLWPTLRWVTIPATSIAAFLFFGFIVAGEEIENPFGYDKNDLNLDHFCRNIIHAELMAITSVPVPDPKSGHSSEKTTASLALRVQSVHQKNG